MKRKNIYLVMLLVFSSFLAMQSCTKDETPTPALKVAPVPSAPVPADGAVIPFTGAGQTITLAWTGTSTETIKWTVYFDGEEVATDLSANTYNVTVATGGAYTWYVETTDGNMITTASPEWTVIVNSNPATPFGYVPANAATGFSVVGALKWRCSDAEDDEITYKVYLGTTNTPGIVASVVGDTTYSPTLLPSTLYYWKVVAIDANGGTKEGPLQTFTSGLEAISAYAGNYNCDEPAEAYSYGVTFTKASSTTIKTTNYWNSGWTATFTLDLTKLTWTMTSYTFSTGWTGVESGIIDPVTMKLVGTYTLWKNGVIQEQGVHTYTHL